MSQGSASVGLPSLELIARMLPLRLILDHQNLAGFSSITEYTVPAGRAAIINTLVIEQRGGVLYGDMGFNFKAAGTGNAGLIVIGVPSANFRPIQWEGWLWLQDTDTLASQVSGGDSTSDYRAVVSGVEFDWEDVVS